MDRPGEQQPQWRRSQLVGANNVDVDVDLDVGGGEMLCSLCQQLGAIELRTTASLPHAQNFRALLASAAAGCASCRLLRNAVREPYISTYLDDADDDADMSALDNEIENDVGASFPLLLTLYPWRLEIAFAEKKLSSALYWFEEGMANEEVKSKSNVKPSAPPPPTIPIQKDRRLYDMQKTFVAKSWLDKALRGGQLPSNYQRPDVDYVSPRFGGKIDRQQVLQLGEYPTLPSRVLQIQRHDDEQLRVWLIEPSILERGRYATLSYRWGQTQHFLLKKENLRALKASVPYGKLPKTFQDAIKTASLLDLRYIWIDALCIVQDDADDWREQSVLMGKFYSNATCNIAVHCAGSDNSGFLDRALRKFPAVQLSKGTSASPAFFISRRGNFRLQVDCSLLSTRGWVLQERLLSPRILHLADCQIFWEDKHGKIVEDNEASLPPSTESSKYGGDLSRLSLPPISNWRSVETRKDASPSLASYFLSFLSPPNSAPSINLPHAIYEWREVVTRYSNCHLTYANDKLPALTGMAQYIQKIRKADYLTGLWADAIHTELLWLPRDQLLHRPSANTPRAPSWSWASLDGPIQYVLKDATSGAPCMTLCAVDNATYPTTAPTAYGSVKAEASGTIKREYGRDSDYGRLFMNDPACRLTVRSTVSPLVSLDDSTEPNLRGVVKTSYLKTSSLCIPMQYIRTSIDSSGSSSKQNYQGWVSLDQDESISGSIDRHIVCAPLSLDARGQGMFVLLLIHACYDFDADRKIDDELLEYRRVGIGFVSGGWECFMGLPEKVFIII